MDMQSAIVVKLPETFSADGARRLKQELRTKIGDGTPRVVIDLSKVKNIDLKGLEALLNCMDEIARRDGAIQLFEEPTNAASARRATITDGTGEFTLVCGPRLAPPDLKGTSWNVE